MSFTNKELLKVINKAQKNYKLLTHVTDKKTLSTEDRLKIGLCKHFVQFAYSKRILIKDISEMTGIPKTRLSEITNYKIKKFTVDKLIQNLSLLTPHDPSIKAYLELLGDTAELPKMKVKETKKLSQNLKIAGKRSQNLNYI